MPPVTKSPWQIAIDAMMPKLAEAQPFERRIFPVNANWCSQLGHPCERYLYHNRKDWEQKKTRDWKGIGERGNLIHEWWKRRMTLKGFAITENERPIPNELREQYQISGKIDGRISNGSGRTLLYEFKTANEFEFKKINTYEDIVTSRKDYVKGYIAQIQLYLYAFNEEAGLFVFCNASTLEWKPIPVYLDYSYCEWLLQRAERINKALTFNRPPARIPYGKTCQKCDFAHICLPDIKNEGLEFRDDERLLSLLRTREQLRQAADEYRAADDEAKDIAKAIGKDCIIGTDFKIELKRITTRRVDTKAIPIEVRSQYEIESEQIRVEFVPLDGGSKNA